MPHTVSPRSTVAHCLPRPSAGLWTIGLAWVLSLSTSGCSFEQADPPAQNLPVAVRAAVAAEKSVPVELRAIGRVEPKQTVSIKARVSGEIKSVAFEEGHEVTKGQLLFTVDPRPFEAALNEAKANLAKDEATLENAEADLRRAEKLVRTATIAQEVYEAAQARVKALAATVKADRAAIEAAAVQLDYCTIRSPIDGRAGELLVRLGNVVKADDAAPLVVINLIAPIDVKFAVPEQEVPRIRKYCQEAEKARKTLRVLATVPGETAPEVGALDFVDNTVDRLTGTIELKAEFANRDQRLWPGQFVDVVLRLTEIPNAVVVPSEAIQTGQEGPYVVVIRPDGAADFRPVVQGIQVGSETVIQQGVKAGERVVTDGQLRLAPGVKVDVKSGLDTEGKAA